MSWLLTFAALGAVLQRRPNPLLFLTDPPSDCMLDQPVRIAPDARLRILDSLASPALRDTYGLRVGVRGGGCGTAWLLGFDTPGPADEVYNVEDVRVIIDRRHLLYVLGVEIGYGLADGQAGFTVSR
jgi:iron-sulfur cluster assembly protein